MIRLGLYDHFGWAVAVAVDDGHVVDRRHVELTEPGVPAAPVHHEGVGLTDDEIAVMIAGVRDSIARCVATELDLVVAEVGPIGSLHLRSLPATFPTDLPTIRRPPYESRADAIMYREVIAEVAGARGIAIGFYDAKDVLGAVPDAVLQAPRVELGAPWTKDHRVALAATIVADG